MTDIEKRLKAADFTAGSDHKERLRRALFGAKVSSVSGELTEDELGFIAAAQGKQQEIPENLKKNKKDNPGTRK